tara:strand:- start:5749 stop:6528 length:780 start_codon:yes stop_codon:yes gene_type:complete
MTLSQSDIETILKTGTYPYTLQYYRRKQKFPLYPSVEVLKTQPDSTTTDITKTSTESQFEITLLIKFTRREEEEEVDQIVIENEIQRVLKVADVEPTGKIFFESGSWSRQPLDVEVFGMKSVLRFTYRNVTSTSGSGIVGSTSLLELNSDGTPVVIQLLDYDVSGEGVDIQSHIDDTGITQYDPISVKELEIRVTYENTDSIESVIETAGDNRVDVQGKITRNGVAKNHTFLVGNTTKRGQYSDVEKATTTLYVTGTWT